MYSRENKKYFIYNREHFNGRFYKVVMKEQKGSEKNDK